MDDQINSTIYQLHFELVDYHGRKLEFYGNTKHILTQYGKVQKGFTRDVLVPGTMSLASLHYMIQRLFGWQNSHLHNFWLDESAFDMMTARNRVDEWLALCGVVFRFVNEDVAETYCNDGDNKFRSFESWLKSKYCGKDMRFCIADTYVDNQRRVREFRDARKNCKFLQATRLDHIEYFVDLRKEYNCLRESLCVHNVFLEPNTEWEYISWKEMQAAEIDKLASNDSELCQYFFQLKQARAEYASMWRTEGDDVKKTPAYKKTLQVHRKKLVNIEKVCVEMNSNFEPKVFPFTNTLLYSYDYGDRWCVRITCDRIYKPDRIENQEFRDQLHYVAITHEPVCVASDGVALLDDVGGIHCFITMLEQLHGRDAGTAKFVKERAREKGWTGRLGHPSSML